MGLVCDFCKEERRQMGLLSCGHQICARCFPSLSLEPQRCYLCILNAVYINRSNMHIIAADAVRDANDKSPTQESVGDEKVFCVYDGCAFIASRAQMAVHAEYCKFRLLSDCETDSVMSTTASPDDVPDTTEPSFVARHRKMRKRLISNSRQQGTHNQQAGDKMESDAGSLQCGREQPSKEHRQQQQQQRNEEQQQRQQKPPQLSRCPRFFELIASAVVVALALNWYGANKDISPILQYPEGENPDQQNGVSVTFSGISDLATRARFNKRDVIISKQMSIDRYKVKLGVGASLSSNDNVVNLWVSAVLTKADLTADWAIGEALRLSLEHSDRNQRRSYDFLFAQEGTWKEHVRVRRGELLFRQLQVDTTSDSKYFRFSCLLTYEEALLSGYIKDDSVTVSFSIETL